MSIHIHTHINKQSLADYYILSHEIQVIAFFLPEASKEMFQDIWRSEFQIIHCILTCILPGHCSSLVWWLGRPGHYVRDLPSILAACEKWKENTYSFETYCDNFLTAFISSFSSLAAHFIICLPLLCTGCKGSCPLQSTNTVPARSTSG